MAHLTKWINLILQLKAEGYGTRFIASQLRFRNIHSPQWENTDSGEMDIIRLQALINYEIRCYQAGLTNYVETEDYRGQFYLQRKSPPELYHKFYNQAKNKRHKWYVGKKRYMTWLTFQRTRPIDMGGVRNIWLTWTPEQQYREEDND